MKVKKILLMFMGFMMGLSLSLSPAVIHADSDDPKPTSIRKLNYKKRTVRVGQKFELKAYARPYDYDDDQLIWSTSNKKIVKITKKGKITGKKDYLPHPGNKEKENLHHNGKEKSEKEIHKTNKDQTGR